MTATHPETTGTIGTTEAAGSTEATGTTGTTEKAGSTGTTEKTGARTAEAAGLITGARDRIDALDDRILGLVQERMAVSAVIQDARIASGGRRVNLSREMEILGRYSDALGKPGTTLAMTLLELCRGRV
ncbi:MULTISPECIES: chorismate mutase [unclassified Streptomyces]|uniref:chorismate mutase n=1 Tax=unclassified Streptomyces TaxID=2593676 RepID=UPI0004BEA708|nr:MULTISPECIES: chorismate mutase [unclassified Streptomyces]